jgi:hypothetical protein
MSTRFPSACFSSMSPWQRLIAKLIAFTRQF